MYKRIPALFVMLTTASLISCSSRTDSDIVAMIEAKCSVKNAVNVEHYRGDAPWSGWSAIREVRRLTTTEQACLEEQAEILGYKYRHWIAPPYPGTD